MYTEVKFTGFTQTINELEFVLAETLKTHEEVKSLYARTIAMLKFVKNDYTKRDGALSKWQHEIVLQYLSGVDNYGNNVGHMTTYEAHGAFVEAVVRQLIKEIDDESDND